MQGSAVYALPTVFQDLKDPQVRLDLCSSLQQLDTVITDVFAHIKERADVERERLQKVNDRIAACQGKINALRGSTKATTVFSTSKYPVSGKLPALKTLFHDRHFADVPPLGEMPDDSVHFQPPESTVGQSRGHVNPELLERKQKQRYLC